MSRPCIEHEAPQSWTLAATLEDSGACLRVYPRTMQEPGQGPFPGMPAEGGGLGATACFCPSGSAG